MINKRIKQITKNLLPAIILKKYYALNSNFKSTYLSWEEVKRLSVGYDSDIALDKTKESMLKVKNNEYAFARDSVLFDSIQYSFPVLAGLLRAALANCGELNVLDFGGSLGTSYYQCRNFLEGLKKLTWNIVELPKFVACGRQFFENKELKFYYSIDECCKNEKPHVMLLSGVIQYIEKPYSLLEDIMRRNFEYLIFDRTSFKKRVRIDWLYKKSLPISTIAVTQSGFLIMIALLQNYCRDIR